MTLSSSDPLTSILQATWRWLHTPFAVGVIRAALVVIGAMLAARLVRWSAGRLADRVAKKDSDSLVPTEKTKQRRALLNAVSWIGVVLVYSIAGIDVLDAAGLPVSSLVAPATALGAAVGFGSQWLVRDLLSGFFIITEGQFGIGDVIRVSSVGSESGVQGVVEDVTLRTTCIRTGAGEVVTFPNGEIRQVSNLSKDWSQVVVDLPLATDQNVDVAASILERISGEIRAEQEWADLLLDGPEVVGVTSIGEDKLVMRVSAKTLPAKQFEVARELRRRISLAMASDSEELNLPSGTASQ